MEIDFNVRLGDIVNVRVFNQNLIILSNYGDATKLMYEAKYSDRLQTVMVHELYVSPTTPTMSLICLQQDGLQLGRCANDLRPRVASLS